MGKKLSSPPLIYVIMQVNISQIMAMPKYIGDLQDQVRKEFPNSNKLIVQVHKLIPELNRIESKPIEQWYFEDREKTTGIIVDEENFFIHTTNYATFKDLARIFVDILDKFNVILKGFTYKKLGLRYVNFIENSDHNVSQGLLGFNLCGENHVEDKYISKVETFQKTKQGAIRVKSATFNHENQHDVNKYLPPDLLETAARLFIPEGSKELFINKFTTLDIDHYTISSDLIDFSINHIIEKFKVLHETIGTAFKCAVTDTAMKKWE